MHKEHREILKIMSNRNVSTKDLAITLYIIVTKELMKFLRALTHPLSSLV